MQQLIGKKELPISTSTIKEVRTKTGVDSIRVWCARYESSQTVVIMYFCDLINNGKLCNRWQFSDKYEALDQYYDLIFQGYRNRDEFVRTNGQSV